MEDNTALLWYLLSTITEQWAIRGQRMDATIRVVEMIEHAKKQGQTSDTATPLHLAHELVQALASPDRRGLIDALEDIRSKIGETPPTRQQLVEAIDSISLCTRRRRRRVLFTGLQDRSTLLERPT